MPYVRYGLQRVRCERCVKWGLCSNIDIMRFEVSAVAVCRDFVCVCVLTALSFVAVRDELPEQHQQLEYGCATLCTSVCRSAKRTV